MCQFRIDFLLVTHKISDLTLLIVMNRTYVNLTTGRDLQETKDSCVRAISIFYLKTPYIMFIVHTMCNLTILWFMYTILYLCRFRVWISGCRRHQLPRHDQELGSSGRSRWVVHSKSCSRPKIRVGIL